MYVLEWVTPVLWPSQLSRKQMCNGNRLQFYQWTEQKSEDSCVNNKYLHRFDLDYLPNEECEKLIDPKLTILPSFICASSTRYKTFCSYCRYGSPLVITLENDQHIIIGLMFARRGSEHLLVFTQVFEFSTWVLDGEKDLVAIENNHQLLQGKPTELANLDEQILNCLLECRNS
uniref:Uncharacterized protein n=1 Tax=Timema monikensis TaxID=170555 RepID=A0A7R9EGK2_9NEOP|nr:unnamed protein product [Timema monikensis]